MTVPLVQRCGSWNTTRQAHNRAIMLRELSIPDNEYIPDPVRDVPFAVDKIAGGLRKVYPPLTGRDPFDGAD